MDSKTLRQKFLDYFQSKNHRIVAGSSLVPANDPSVLFTTAGMQQFKRFYAAPAEAPAPNVATVQPCVRTSDIEEVGDDSHLTFFEMLGNFSFGGYAKKEAIFYAWEFLTEVLEIDQSRLSATYFGGTKELAADEESLQILQKIDGLTIIKPQGFEDNFWSLGTANSPGGPTVELYIDDIEIWNLVFNEYVFCDGQYKKTDFKGVDTGMGLERLLTIINRAENVYATDLFELSSQKLRELLAGQKNPPNEKIILDHIKAAVFIINDGIVPQNKDRGYIARRLIRRAIVKAHQLGISENFTTQIADEVIKTYEGVYTINKENVLAELEKEETKFRRTLNQGLRKIEKHRENLDGKKLFDLYQTYGFPLELSLEYARENGMEIDNIDIEQYNNELQKHQELSRTASAGMFRGGLAEAGEVTAKYHTATHLLLAALRQVLGESVLQRGSNITAERLRFDFCFPDKLTAEQIKEVEDLVNAKIKEDLAVVMREMTLKEAKADGALGVFEHKYGDKVKVYGIGEFSREICGGPHAARTGELGRFKIIKEESSSAGTRRIKAILE